MSSDDAYRLIHKALGDWIVNSLENGFDDDPLRGDYCANLLKMAQIMRNIEGHADVATD